MKDPAEPEHVSVEVPLGVEFDNDRVVGDRAQAMPLVGETDDVRVTVPENPFWPETVTVKVLLEPASIVALFGFEEMVKLRAEFTINVTVTEWDRLPLVPVTPMLNVPMDENVQDNLAVPEPARLVGLTTHEVLFVDRLTTAWNPLSGVTIMLDAAALLTLALTVDELAVIL